MKARTGLKREGGEYFEMRLKVKFVWNSYADNGAYRLLLSVQCPVTRIVLHEMIHARVSINLPVISELVDARI